MDPIPRLIPMSWDQRHTLNASVGYRTHNYTASLTARYGSGSPYTYAPLPETRLAAVNLYPNNAKMPSQYSVDMYANYSVPVLNNMKLRFELQCL